MQCQEASRSERAASLRPAISCRIENRGQVFVSATAYTSHENNYSHNVTKAQTLLCSPLEPSICSMTENYSLFPPPVPTELITSTITPTTSRFDSFITTRSPRCGFHVYTQSLLSVATGSVGMPL